MKEDHHIKEDHHTNHIVFFIDDRGLSKYERTELWLQVYGQSSRQDLQLDTMCWEFQPVSRSMQMSKTETIWIDSF